MSSTLLDKWNDIGENSGGTIKISSDVLNRTRLSGETKQFLAEYGLINELYFGTENINLTPLPFAFTDKRQLSSQYERYRVLGEVGYQMYECLDEISDGRVVIVKLNGTDSPEVIFVNSSITQFAECEIAWFDVWSKLETDNILTDSKSFQEIIDVYESELLSIDPLIFSESNSWRVHYLSKLRQGILD